MKCHFPLSKFTAAFWKSSAQQKWPETSQHNGALPRDHIRNYHLIGWITKQFNKSHREDSGSDLTECVGPSTKCKSRAYWSSPLWASFYAEARRWCMRSPTKQLYPTTCDKLEWMWGVFVFFFFNRPTISFSITHWYSTGDGSSSAINSVHPWTGFRVCGLFLATQLWLQEGVNQSWTGQSGQRTQPAPSCTVMLRARGEPSSTRALRKDGNGEGWSACITSLLTLLTLSGTVHLRF